MSFNSPLQGRDGSLPPVMIYARSSVDALAAQSLSEQISRCEEYVRDRWPSVVRLQHVHSRANGDSENRPDLAYIKKGIGLRKYCVLIVECHSRIGRRHSVLDVQVICEKTNTRFFAIDESIDNQRGP